MGLSGKEKGAAQGGCASAPSPSPIRTRRGGKPLSLSLPPPPRILFQLGLGGGILLPEGVGLSWRASPRPAEFALKILLVAALHRGEAYFLAIPLPVSFRMFPNWL